MYQLAAEHGYAKAQYNLGVMYQQGQGATSDNKAAIKWYQLAAEQGHAIAQNNLGFMYGRGLGVPKSLIYAFMWWDIAASKGNKDAIFGRDQVLKTLSPSQLEEAKALVRQCMEQNYKNC